MKIWLGVVFLITSYSFAVPIDLSTTEGKVEFLAVGQPSALKIRGKLSDEKPISGSLEVVDGSLSGTAKVKLDGFDTGIELRNRHMKEKYLETGKYPETAVKLEPTEGTELSKQDDEAVRKVLLDYLDALKKKEYARAGELIDRESLLSTVEPMVHSISADSTHTEAARRKIYGVSTPDSVAKTGNGPLFASLMAYLLSTNPDAAKVMEMASIEVLATRQIHGKASVAYQLSIPSPEKGGMPYEQVTAQQMRKTNGKWRILFRLD